MNTRRPIIGIHFDKTGIEISSEGMRYESFADYQIFRPRLLTERTVLDQESKDFLSAFNHGQYTEMAEINSAIKHLCKFYGQILEENLPKLASRDYIEFLLGQYDESFKVEMAARQGKLSQEEFGQWVELGRVFRRAIKYLLERVCSLAPRQPLDLSDEELLWTTEVVQISAEEFVQLCMLSDSTYSIFPSETQLTVFPVGSPKLYLLEVLNERALQMGNRVEIDGKNRSRVLNGKSFDSDLSAQNEYLGESFVEAHGIKYKDAIELLGHLVNSVEPSDGPFGIQFFHKEDLLSSFSGNLNISRSVLEKVFSGFLVTAEKLNADPEVIWNPKRSHRAYRRALFEVPHSDGICWAWCKGMAHEALETLIQGAVFQHFPDEWRSPAINSALAKLDNDRGKWFEQCAANSLNSVGYHGILSVKKLSTRDAIVHVPDAVGELDFIGYSTVEQRLVLLEFKMTTWTSEPKMWREDLHRFLSKDRGYDAKLRRKRDWVLTNLESVKSALASHLSTTVVPTKFSFAMITYWPNISSCFINDFPCVSLAELIAEIEKTRQWPYQLGEQML